jgi:hypothetical protein
MLQNENFLSDEDMVECQYILSQNYQLIQTNFMEVITNSKSYPLADFNSIFEVYSDV